MGTGGGQTAGRQQEICDALALTAQRISDHTQLQAGETIAEISRLVQAAADAPKAAACRPSWPHATRIACRPGRPRWRT